MTGKIYSLEYHKYQCKQVNTCSNLTLELLDNCTFNTLSFVFIVNFKHVIGCSQITMVLNKLLVKSTEVHSEFSQSSDTLLEATCSFVVWNYFLI